MFTTDERERVRAAVLARAAEDPAVVCAAVTGSHALGESDRWSDIDLALGIAGPVEQSIQAWTRWLTQDFDVRHHWDLVSGTSTYRVFLLPGWLELDLAFTPADDFRGRGPRWRLVFGDEQPALPRPLSTPDVDRVVGHAWHHVLHARTCIERGRWWQAEHWIGAARACVLQLACLRHGYPAEYAKGAHLLPDDELRDLGATLVAALTGQELSRALDAILVAFAAELDRSDVQSARRLAPMLADLSTGRSPQGWTRDGSRPRPTSGRGEGEDAWEPG